MKVGSFFLLKRYETNKYMIFFYYLPLSCIFFRSPLSGVIYLLIVSCSLCIETDLCMWLCMCSEMSPHCYMESQRQVSMSVGCPASPAATVSYLRSSDAQCIMSAAVPASSLTVTDLPKNSSTGLSVPSESKNMA